MSLHVYLDLNDEVYCRQITHNLNRMAAEAGIYNALWHPEDIAKQCEKCNGSGEELLFISATTCSRCDGQKVESVKAEDLISILENGLAKLKWDPDRFNQLAPSNGWGTYDGLVQFVESYLFACRKWPKATVRVCR